MEKNLEEKIKEFEREVLRLKMELENTRLREIEKEKNLNNYVRDLEKARELNLSSYIRDLEKAKELNINAAFREQELKNLATSWERIVDELAHSINTDVYVAVSSMSKFLDNPKIKKANYHTRQIRDLTNLLLLFLKRDDIEYSNEFTEFALSEVVAEQIALIKDGISTLRISSDEHEESLLKMVIPVTIIGETKIAINEEFADAIPLVIKDLVRNAMKHTPDHDPKVEITLTESELFVEVMIHNNGAISEKLANWFNKSSLEDPENMSKSSKVGLRVVKKWVDLLKIETRYLRDENNDTTTVKLNFPKRISYEKN